MLKITLCRIGGEKYPETDGIATINAYEPYEIRITFSNVLTEIMKNLTSHLNLHWCCTVRIDDTHVTNVKFTHKNRNLIVRNLQNGTMFVPSNNVQQVVVEINLILSSMPSKHINNKPILDTDGYVKDVEILNTVPINVQRCPISHIWNIYTTAHPYIHMFESSQTSMYSTLAYNLKLQFEKLDKIANLERQLSTLGTKRRNDNSKQNMINLKRRRQASKCDIKDMPPLESMSKLEN